MVLKRVSGEGSVLAQIASGERDEELDPEQAVTLAGLLRATPQRSRRARGQRCRRGKHWPAKSATRRRRSAVRNVGNWSLITWRRHRTSATIFSHSADNHPPTMITVVWGWGQHSYRHPYLAPHPC